MIKQYIKEINAELIQLLGKKIDLLRGVQAPASNAGVSPLQEIKSNDDNESDIPSILNQAGVPQFVWQNLVINCQAAVKSRLPTNLQAKPRRVTIIGGGGMMGSFFAQKLSAAGHQVTILGHDDWDKAEELLNDRDLVLICVPIEYTTEVIQKTVKYLSPNTALADLTSIKTPALKTMLEYHSGAVIGLHPMFGKVQSFLSQKVVVCSGRRDEEFQWLLKLIEADGGELIHSTAEEHDRMMVAVQAIRQFTTFSLGVFLAEQELDARRSLDFASPPYRLQLGMISRLLTQSAPMVIDIMLATTESRQAIGKLAATYARLAKLVKESRREELIAEFGAIQAYLVPQMDCCLTESHHVINALSNFLNGKRQETENVGANRGSPLQKEEGRRQKAEASVF
ncbi:Chorismate mutase [Stanieria cyanosphaera PCC 7437]|uniref:Chorismate mutase n=1 Tax=Stanieria cyanosphaera (strain ATCC 29371 / PCC 7437) TaxID=111780 RepID=K9XMV5_STAC7|nr:prephenate dehydrogenase/arogenate dehydrogenase family protein [Stanieria cyanosphaera]AFZ33843.1 Chorismate mutase [Stanieria cyanosphaera PCC 7437]